ARVASELEKTAETPNERELNFILHSCAVSQLRAGIRAGENARPTAAGTAALHSGFFADFWGTRLYQLGAGQEGCPAQLFERLFVAQRFPHRHFGYGVDYPLEILLAD